MGHIAWKCTLVVVKYYTGLASLMSNIFLIQTPITIFDRCLA